MKLLTVCHLMKTVILLLPKAFVLSLLALLLLLSLESSPEASSASRAALHKHSSAEVYTGLTDPFASTLSLNVNNAFPYLVPHLQIRVF